MKTAAETEPETPGAEPAGTLEPGTRLGRYTVRGLLGAGGMGRVYAARDDELDRSVAVKVTARGGGSGELRFMREAQAMARLVHPNVVSIFDVGTYAGGVFVAMELVDGETLAAWLAAEPRGWRAVREVFVAAGRGLAATHAAGMVHRDFKPDNVLVAGGRVVVADFGLARAELDTAAEGPVLSMLGVEVTGAGGVVGTPGYIAPEVLAGGAATPRSDQYSFCVALGEALGGRPPRFLSAVVERGRRAKPEQRYPSIDALLADLARDPGRTARRLAAALGAAGAVVAGTIALARPNPAAACAAGARDRVAAVWNEGRRGSIATGAARALPMLDGYARALEAAGDEACRATHVRRQQSEALLDLRVACLDRRTRHLDALVTALAGPLDVDAASHATRAAADLPLVADCADTAQLAAVAPLPADAAARGRIEGALTTLASVQVLYRLGRVAEAKAALARAGAAAGEVGYAPLASDVTFWRAWFDYKDLKPAEAPMAESIHLAVAARDVKREARGWLGLFGVLADRSDRLAETLQVERAAAMAVERAGDAARDRALLAMTEGRAYANAGRLADAETAFLAALDRAPVDDFWSRATTLELLARILGRHGRQLEAAAVGKQAVALWERSIGSDNPVAAEALIALGRAYGELGRRDDAREALLRAAGGLEAAYGADHPQLSDVYNQLALLAARQHDASEARRWAERSVAANAPARTTNPVDYVDTLNQAGFDLTEAGAPADGLPYLEQARALESSAGIGGASAALTRYYLGIAETNLGRPEAVDDCAAAERTLGQFFGDDLVTGAMQCRAEALAVLGRHAEAVPVFEAALARMEKNGTSPGALRDTRAALARAQRAAKARR